MIFKRGLYLSLTVGKLRQQIYQLQNKKPEWGKNLNFPAQTSRKLILIGLNKTSRNLL
jgi:hypothetical protein